jgi:SlyX protein
MIGASIRQFCCNAKVFVQGAGTINPLVFDNAGLFMEERLIDLESKLCLAEDLLEELNLTVFRQQQQIDQLQAQIRVLYRQMQSSMADGVEKRDLREEIPPHY